MGVLNKLSRRGSDRLEGTMQGGTPFLNLPLSRAVGVNLRTRGDATVGSYWLVEEEVAASASKARVVFRYNATYGGYLKHSLHGFVIDFAEVGKILCKPLYVGTNLDGSLKVDDDSRAFTLLDATENPLVASPELMTLKASVLDHAKQRDPKASEQRGLDVLDDVYMEQLVRVAQMIVAQRMAQILLD